MRALATGDILFLALEKRNQPMHIGGLFLFRLPDGAPNDFVYNLVQELRKSKNFAVDPFNRVLHKGLFWKADTEFDMDDHFRHISLPKPGRIRELLVYVSQEHSCLLDRAKPLWECHIIEGIEDNRFALYFKMHHAVVDGIAAIRLIKKAMTSTAEEPLKGAPWALKNHKRTAKSAPNDANAKLTVVKEQLNTLPVVSKELWQGFKRFNDPNFIKPRHTPASILNQPISASRRVAAQSYKISRFKQIAKYYKTTINNVVLAICSGALRNYLMSLDSLPKKPLTAFVPISLRKDDSDTGNQISFMLTNLATNIEDPEERLGVIIDSVNENKERFGRMNQKQIINYSILFYAMAMSNLITGVMPKRQGFNLIISNVPGASKPLFWGGAQLDALYPLSVLMDGQAMNITLTSYVDKIEFGIVANTKSLPKIQSILALIENQIEVYETDIPKESKPTHQQETKLKVV